MKIVKLYSTDSTGGVNKISLEEVESVTTVINSGIKMASTYVDTMENLNNKINTEEVWASDNASKVQYEADSIKKQMMVLLSNIEQVNNKIKETKEAIYGVDTSAGSSVN